MKVIERSITTIALDSKSNQFTFSCKETALLPNFDLLFGGYWLELTVKDYVIVG